MSEKEILSAFDLRSPPTSIEIKEALKSIEEKYSENSIELVKVAVAIVLELDKSILRGWQNYGKPNLRNIPERFWKL